MGRTADLIHKLDPIHYRRLSPRHCCVGPRARTTHPSTTVLSALGPCVRRSFPKSHHHVACSPLPRAGADCLHKSQSRHALQPVLGALTVAAHALPVSTRLFTMRHPPPCATPCRTPVTATAAHWPMPRRHAHRSVKPFKANGPLRPAWSPSRCHPAQPLGVSRLPCASGTIRAR
jgi:hypothetical protein